MAADVLLHDLGVVQATHNCTGKGGLVEGCKVAWQHPPQGCVDLTFEI
jgi:hypothetical protein